MSSLCIFCIISDSQDFCLHCMLLTLRKFNFRAFKFPLCIFKSLKNVCAFWGVPRCVRSHLGLGVCSLLAPFSSWEHLAWSQPLQILILCFLRPFHSSTFNKNPPFLHKEMPWTPWEITSHDKELRKRQTQLNMEKHMQATTQSIYVCQGGCRNNVMELKYKKSTHWKHRVLEWSWRGGQTLTSGGFVIFS